MTMTTALIRKLQREPSEKRNFYFHFFFLPQFFLKRDSNDESGRDGERVGGMGGLRKKRGWQPESRKKKKKKKETGMRPNAGGRINVSEP